jgi:MscS family membrane protein
MRRILLILFILVSVIFSAEIDGTKSIQIDDNSTIVTKVEKVIEDATDTIQNAVKTGDADSAFQVLLYEMNKYFENKKLYFEFLQLNTAKLILIFFILGSSWFVRYLVSKIIELGFTNKESDSLVFKLVDSVKVPFLWFLIFWSIYWSIKVYLYPNLPTDSLKSIFNTIHLFTGAWLVWNGLSNYKHIVVANRNRRLKVEEVELIIISLKILLITAVSLVTIYMYWPELLKYIGGAGVVIGIIMKDSVASYFTTFKLVVDDDFSVGDWIKTSKMEGYIDSIGLFYTKVRAFDNGLVLVPNSELIKDSTVNYDRRTNRRIKFFFYLPINMSADKIESILIDIKNMLEHHQSIASNRTLSSDKKMDAIRKRKHGFSDILLVNLVNVEHGHKVMIYAFTTKNDWQFQLDTQQEVILEIKKILESYGCSLIIEAKYLQNPFDSNEVSQLELDKEKI